MEFFIFLLCNLRTDKLLEDVKSLVLAEIDNLKKNFDADLIPAIVNNIKNIKFKVQKTTETELVI